MHIHINYNMKYMNNLLNYIDKTKNFDTINTTFWGFVMADLSIGYLFKKRYVMYEKKKYEFFEFIKYIAELAIAKQSGARSLKTVFDDCISSALFRIFAGEYSSISLMKPDDENNKP